MAHPRCWFVFFVLWTIVRVRFIVKDGSVFFVLRQLWVISLTWDQALFLFRFLSEILAGKRNVKRGPIIARQRKKECMEAAKIGPDLRL